MCTATEYTLPHGVRGAIQMRLPGTSARPHAPVSMTIHSACRPAFALSRFACQSHRGGSGLGDVAVGVGEVVGSAAGGAVSSGAGVGVGGSVAGDGDGSTGSTSGAQCGGGLVTTVFCLDSPLSAMPAVATGS